MVPKLNRKIHMLDYPYAVVDNTTFAQPSRTVAWKMSGIPVTNFFREGEVITYFLESTEFKERIVVKKLVNEYANKRNQNFFYQLKKILSLP